METASRLRGNETSGHPLVGIDATPLASGHAIRGIGRYVASLLEALRQEEPDWCAEQLGILVSRGANSTWPAARTWRARRASVRPQDIGWLASPVFDRLGLRGTSPRLWHQTDPSSPFAPLPSRRTIATVYDLIPLRDAAVMRRMRFHRRIPYRLYLRNVRRAGLVIAISEVTAREVNETLGVPLDRVRVVYPSVVPLTAAAPERAARSGSEPEFLFVGIPDPHKRPDLAIDALAAFRAINHAGRLTFVGFHPRRDRERLVERARRASVASAVTFADQIDDQTLAGLFASSTLLALSRIEGFGLPPVEALLAGGRVVAVPEPIYEEVLGRAACYAAEASPESIAEAMSEASRIVPPAEALRLIEARFSRRATADALLAAYGAARDL